MFATVARLHKRKLTTPSRLRPTSSRALRSPAIIIPPIFYFIPDIIKVVIIPVIPPIFYFIPDIIKVVIIPVIPPVFYFIPDIVQVIIIQITTVGKIRKLR